MTVKTVIVMKHDRYNEVGGCKPCIFLRRKDTTHCFNGCGANVLPVRDYLRCAIERGYWVREVKASVSRNKREGRSVGHRVRSKVINHVKYSVPGRAHARVHHD